MAHHSSPSRALSICCRITQESFTHSLAHYLMMSILSTWQQHQPWVEQTHIMGNGCYLQEKARPNTHTQVQGEWHRLIPTVIWPRGRKEERQATPCLLSAMDLLLVVVRPLGGEDKHWCHSPKRIQSFITGGGGGGGGEEALGVQQMACRPHRFN